MRIILFILAGLLIGGGVMFYSLQKYLVYGQDSVDLRLPILATPTPAAVDEGGFALIDTELSVLQPDYTEVEAVAGEGLTSMRALVVPAESVNDEGIALYRRLLAAYDADTLLLELKPESGQLVYASQVDTAVNYGLSGSYDLASLVESLNNEGVRIAALLSCCVDATLAQRYSQLALQTSYGGIVSDSTGMWLDPNNSALRSYIADLTKELGEMGVTEVVYKNICMPAGNDFVYSVQMSYTPTARTSISGFALALRNAIGTGSGVTLSAILTEDTLHNGAAESTGQDAALFLKVFDRVCGAADSAWQYGLDRDTLAPNATLGDMNQRYVPIMTYSPEGASCWIVNVPENVMEAYTQ